MWRVGTRIERRFSEQAGVRCRGYSRPLQRVVTDFGADEPFGRVPAKLQEHYGIEVPVSAIQRITFRHAEGCRAQEPVHEVRKGALERGVFIGEVDGSMVPVVETEPEAPGRRRAKTVLWKEVRLCRLVHAHGQATPVFGGHFSGGVEASGRQLEQCAARAGFGPGSELHAVGDGAPWIAEQVALRFGTQGHYLLDFYHVCGYLAAAAKTCAANDPDAWLDQQKARKANQATAVLEALTSFQEPAEIEDAAAPVRTCHRYLANRMDQLDYQGALARGLPIGSGAIESAHRSIIQARLKRPGAWWTPAHVRAMLALRLNRANGEWESYWQGVERKAA
jgi:hypothetical protein